VADGEFEEHPSPSLVKDPGNGEGRASPAGQQRADAQKPHDSDDMTEEEADSNVPDEAGWQNDPSQSAMLRARAKALGLNGPEVLCALGGIARVGDFQAGLRTALGLLAEYADWKESADPSEVERVRSGNKVVAGGR